MIILDLLVLAAIWIFGMRRGWSLRRLWALTGAVWLLTLVWLLAIGREAALARGVGGGATEWIVLGLLGLAIWAYSKILGRLRARARPAPPPPRPPGTFDDAELARYSRHILLHELGGPGQKRLKNARVLVIGAGGLGSPALLYLAAAGVGTIGVIDDDEVDATNLHRQVIHPEAAIGKPKVVSAVEAISAQNPHIAVRPHQQRLTEAVAVELFEDYDLVLDGSDNFDTRYLANRTAARIGMPLIGAAMTQWEGQISTWDPARGGPCYECIFPERPAPGLVPTCAEAGVVGPLPGVMGSMMALEAIKEITQAGEGLRGRMLIYDSLNAETRVIRLKKRPDCPVCGKGR